MNMKLFVSILAIALLVLSACGPKQPAAPAPTPAPAAEAAPEEDTGEEYDVDIKGLKFTPPDITVHVGDTVVWTNDDDVPHTVTSADGTLDSEEIASGDTFEYTFDDAGTYEYACSLHPSMKGKVTVVEAVEE